MIPNSATTTSANYLTPLLRPDAVALYRSDDELDTIHHLAEIFLLEHPHLVGEYDERGAIRSIRRATNIATPTRAPREGS